MLNYCLYRIWSAFSIPRDQKQQALASSITDQDQQRPSYNQGHMTAPQVMSTSPTSKYYLKVSLISPLYNQSPCPNAQNNSNLAIVPLLYQITYSLYT